jgi:hypothetical protein
MVSNPINCVTVQILVAFYGLIHSMKIRTPTKQRKGQNHAYALFNSLVQPVRIMCCVHNILVSATSAADMGKQLLLSKVNL